MGTCGTKELPRSASVGARTNHTSVPISVMYVQFGTLVMVSGILCYWSKVETVFPCSFCLQLTEKSSMVLNRISGSHSDSYEFAIFRDIAPCSPYVDRCFGGTYHLHLQGRKSAEQETSLKQAIYDPEDGWNTFLRNVGVIFHLLWIVLISIAMLSFITSAGYFLDYFFFWSVPSK
jgi:hypothetical protein